MSLNWNVKNVENNETVCFVGEGDEREINPITHALIFMTMSVGLGEITDKNADEFYARCHIMEQTHGAYTRIGSEEVYITPQDIQRHIGLYCNVANETRAQWARRIFVGRSKGSIDVSITSDYARNYRRIHEKEVAA
jgi:hypothetical protein